MFKYLLVVVGVLGFTSFIIKNIFFENVRKIPQKTEIASLERSPDDRELFRGVFKGMDSIHNVVGDAVIVETSKGPVLRLEKFSVTPGPDLVVYLVRNDNITFIKDLGGEPASLGSLQKMSGEQTYTLPEKYMDYKSVVIWSRALNILFGAGPIK